MIEWINSYFSLCLLQEIICINKQPGKNELHEGHNSIKFSFFHINSIDNTCRKTLYKNSQFNPIVWADSKSSRSISIDTNKHSQVKHIIQIDFFLNILKSWFRSDHSWLTWFWMEATIWIIHPSFIIWLLPFISPRMNPLY